MNQNNLESKVGNIIKPDSPIDKGEYKFCMLIDEGRKYLSSISDKPITINYEESPRLQELYKTAKEEASKLTGRINKSFILNAVYSVVDKAFEGGESKEIIEEDNRDKIPLDNLIEKKVGTSLYKALTATVLLEQFKKEGHISGEISVDCKKYDNKTHHWVRYTNSKGRVFILDFGSEFKEAVPLENAVLKGKEFYKRQEDKNYI